jgi:hypothetical protein
VLLLEGVTQEPPNEGPHCTPVQPKGCIPVWVTITRGHPPALAPLPPLVLLLLQLAPRLLVPQLLGLLMLQLLLPWLPPCVSAAQALGGPLGPPAQHSSVAADEAQQLPYSCRS